MQIEISGIKIEVQKKNIKNLHLVVSPPDGKVRVSAPLHLSDESIAMFIRTKLSWIKKQQEKFDKHSAAIKDFDYLSVREDELSNQLLDEGIENRIDLDPVFLLSKEEWQKQSKPMKIDGKFIFVYTFAFNEKLKQAIKDTQKRFNCQVIVLMPFTGEKVEKIENCKVIHNYGPREFLYCIDKAEHVITHSFHATAFSIIFNKKFTFVSSALPGRIESLFRKLEITDTENITQKSYQLLEAERHRTKEYLEKIAKEL